MTIQQSGREKIIKNELFMQKAEALKPNLIRTVNHPVSIIETLKDENAIHGWKCNVIESAKELITKAYGKGDSFILDFGTHHVGYLSMSIKPIGSPPDAPLRMRLTFGEMPVEVSEPFSEYNGWISSSWLQEETIYVDVLPGIVHLPRRYSFRYLKVEILDTSSKYKVTFDDVFCNTVTSADNKKIIHLESTDKELEKIDRVSIKTLENCMQDVFEDGPKRDRRLWLGDLRLQALANYETFGNNDLVKRCLYLFASVPNDRGQVSSNLLIEPYIIPDDTYLFDYSLFFATTLHDYYFATLDRETLDDLWPIAYRQIELALERLDKNNVVMDSESLWTFIDWNLDINKQAPSQAILVYAMRKAEKMAIEIKEEDKASFLRNKINDVTKSAVEHLWDSEIGFFVSGSNHQVSWASQIWMVIAGIFDEEESRLLMERLFDENPGIGLTTPYMNHHLVEALLIVGEKKKAISIIRQYWGGMIEYGADTFWEIFNPDDKNYSPYGSYLINSYCHAWSCTPTYLIRKYNLI